MAYTIQEVPKLNVRNRGKKGQSYNETLFIKIISQKYLYHLKQIQRKIDWANGGNTHSMRCTASVVLWLIFSAITDGIRLIEERYTLQQINSQKHRQIADAQLLHCHVPDM